MKAPLPPAGLAVLRVFCEPAVAKACEKRAPLFGSAFAPAEIYNAWKAGVRMLNAFPAMGWVPACAAVVWPLCP